MQTAPLTVLDELYLHLDREEEPFSVHFELRVAGRIDPVALESAVREAALHHPIARARLLEHRATDVHHRWEIGDTLDAVDLTVVDCDSPADLARARERLLSRITDLRRPGPFALLLAHDSGGDVLVMNLHHAAGDGLSAVALMRSIACAYSGEPDPQPRIYSLGARELRGLVGGSLKERVARARAALEYVPRMVRGPARIAAQGGERRPGYGFATASLEPAELERIAGLRAAQATLNDVLLGALAVAVRRWDEEHGAGDGPVYISMPVNLRPADWRFAVMGNFAAYISVRLAADEQDSLAHAIPAAARSTARIKRDGVAGYMVDLFKLPAALPTGLKRRMPMLIPLTRSYSVDTAVLSNLGRLPTLPGFKRGGAIEAVSFSPPGRLPLGASLGIATYEGRLSMTLRYRHAHFDAPAAERFLATFQAVLSDAV